MTSSIPRIPISWVVPQGQCPVLALRRDDVGLQVAHARGLDCCCVQRHVLLRRAREVNLEPLAGTSSCSVRAASPRVRPPPACFLLLPPPFSAPSPVYCGPPGPLHGPCFPVPPVPTGPPCSVRLLYAVSLLVSMSTLQRPSLVLCLVYTNTTAAAAWCAACSLSVFPAPAAAPVLCRAAPLRPVFKFATAATAVLQQVFTSRVSP